MDLALELARQAGGQGEVPVGAVVLAPDGRLLAQAHNAPIGLHDPTGHAEVLALRQAGLAMGNYRLPGSILAVTVEPCLMCLGAAVHARVAGVVFGALDTKAGAVVSNLPGPELPFLNHRFWVVAGIRQAQCADLLSEFFRRRRSKGAPPLDAGATGG